MGYVNMMIWEINEIFEDCANKMETIFLVDSLLVFVLVSTYWIRERGQEFRRLCEPEDGTITQNN